VCVRVCVCVCVYVCVCVCVYLLGNESVPQIIINDTKKLFLKLQSADF